MNLKINFYLKKEFLNWFNSNAALIFFLLISIAFTTYFIFYQLIVCMIIGGLFFILTMCLSQKRLLFLLLYVVAVFIFLFTYQNSRLELKTDKNIEGIGKIVSDKNNYYIVKWKTFFFYLSKTKNSDYVLGQKFYFQSKITTLKSNANYYEFDFTAFLNKKFVFCEMNIIKAEQIKSLSFSFLINEFLYKMNLSNLTKMMWTKQPLTNSTIYDLMVKINLSYLTNSCLLLISPILYKVNKLENKKLKGIFLSSILFLILFVLIVQVENMLLFRILIFWCLKTIFKRRNSKWLNLSTIIVMVMLKPSYILSPGFLFLNAIFVMLCFIKNDKKITEKKVVYFLTFFFLTIGLNAYFNYIVNLTSSFYSLILMPVFTIYGVISIIADLTNISMQLAISNSFVKILTLINNYQISINVGHISFYIFIIYFLCLIKTASFDFMNFKNNLVSLIIIVALITLIFLLKPSNNLAMLNVGNANAFVYHNKWQNITLIFDAGSGKGKSSTLITDYLKYYGINKVDAVFISHFHEDHYNNLFDLQENFNIKQIINREDYLSFYRFKNVNIRIFQNILAKTENDLSLVIFIDVGNFRALLMGDAEISTENHLMNRLDFIYYLKLKKVDLLQVGHHGSKTSSSIDFLKLINAKYAFISGTNEGGNKIFPHIETINNLNKLKISFYITKSENNWFFNINNHKIIKK